MRGLSFLLMFILSISLVSALNFEVDSQVNLNVPCQFNGTNCDVTAVCNISIIYPNETIMIDNNLMTNLGNGLPNITLTDTSVIGEDYKANVVCTQEGISGGKTFPFTISRSGTDLTTGQGLLYLMFMAIALITTATALFWAIRLPFKNVRDEEGIMLSINDLKYLKIFLSIVSYVMIMWLFGIMRSITNNFLTLQGPRLFFEWAYWIMLSFLWPGIVLGFIFSLIIFFNDKKLLAKLERGSPLTIASRLRGR